MTDFLGNVWWFARHWHPVRIEFRTPRFVWRMAMRRQAIWAAIRKGRAQE